MSEGTVLVEGAGLAPPLTAALAEHDVDAWLGLEHRDRPTAVVFVPADLERRVVAPLGAGDRWAEHCEASLLQGLVVAQAAHELLIDGGRLIFVLPDVGITGAAGQVPLATAVEGLRALAKSAGRQWADEGITTATVLVPTDPEAVDVEAVADVVAGLLGPAGAALNGVTLPVSSGLMVP